MHTRRARWIMVIGVWTVFGLYMAFQNHFIAATAGRVETWEVSFVRELLYSSFWAILTPLILFCARRFPLDRAHWLRRGVLHLLLSACVSLSQKLLFGLSYAVYLSAKGISPFAWDSQLRSLLSYFDYGMLLYWILLLITNGIEYYRKYQENLLKNAQLEGQLAQAQLRALRMQLQPHFLFNTLNAISVLVAKDPDKARQTVGWLSDLLRLTLDQGSSQEVPLATELKFLERYLAIERTRFEDRLTVRLHVDKGSTDAQVPTLILQPLVENAIKHGVAHRRGPTWIDITVVRQNGSLILRVRNQVQDGAHPVAQGGEGVGLSNTRARLAGLYGESARMNVREDPENVVTVEITLPYREDVVSGRQE